LGGVLYSYVLGLAGARLGRGGTTLPAAGEFRTVAREILAFEAEPLQHRLDARFHPLRVGGVQLQFQAADLIQQFGVGR